MSVTTYFKKASTSKEAILACRAEGSVLSIETLSPSVFKVTCVNNNRILAVVTDLVTGQGENNIFKVELDSFPT